MDKFKLLLCLLLLFIPYLSSGSAKDEQDLYQEAHQAIMEERFADYLTIEPKLQDHLLLVQLRYHYLKKTLTEQTSDTINTFLSNYATHYLIHPLRTQWLYQLANQKRWDDFLDFYQPTHNVSLQCLNLLALYHTGKTQDALQTVEDLWLVKHSQPAECNAIFTLWKNHGYLTTSLIWQRFALALDHYHLNLARYLMQQLPTASQAIAKEWLRVYANPTVLASMKLPDEPLARQLLVLGLSRLAKRQPDQAIRLWKKLQPQYHFSDQHINRVHESIAVSLALKGRSNSLIWFHKVDHHTTKPVVRFWHVRAALMQQDWKAVADAIERLTPQERKQPCWQYWTARALAMLGQKEKAHSLLKTLATGETYYHFLARRDLGEKLALKTPDPNKLKQQRERIMQHPGIQRSALLRRYDQIFAAKQEWRHALTTMTHDEKHAAVQLAAKWGWHDQVIHYSRRYQFKDHLLHYPLPMRQEIMRLTQKKHLDPALVYAIIHQESAFRKHVTSHAGAIGLMQLMPHTAKQVADSANVNIRDRNDILHQHNNLKLGTTLLRKLLAKFKGNYAFAAGAYNAGHKPVERWLAKHPDLELAIWIETRPWRETRNYMKHIMAKYFMYQLRLDAE